MITFDRKQKKDAFYIYKAWWSKEAFVHLCGKRYHDRIEEVTQVKAYSNQKEVTFLVDGKEVATQKGEHVFTIDVPICGIHKIEALVPGTNLRDEMEIARVSSPNPSYFASADKVRNWFDEKEEEPVEDNGYLSLNSTMAEIQAQPAGAIIIEKMMKQMQKKTAGGMGENVTISPAMQAMIARQPLRKLLQQGGMDLEGEEIKALSKALSKIRKG